MSEAQLRLALTAFKPLIKHCAGLVACNCFLICGMMTVHNDTQTTFKIRTLKRIGVIAIPKDWASLDGEVPFGSRMGHPTKHALHFFVHVPLLPAGPQTSIDV